MVRLPLQGEPGEAAVLVDQAALGGVPPGQGDGAGVGAEEILHPLPGGHMGVAGEEDLGGASGRGIVGGVPVAVGEKDLPALPVLHGVVGGHGKGSPQGLDAVVTVALHPKDLLGQGVEELDDPLGVIAVAGVVGARVGQVPQKNQLFRALLAVEVQQLPAVGKGAVEVGCDQSFHSGVSPRRSSILDFPGKGKKNRGKREFSLFPGGQTWYNKSSLELHGGGSHDRRCQALHCLPLSRVPQTGDCRTDGVPTGRCRQPAALSLRPVCRGSGPVGGPGAADGALPLL